VNVRGEIIGINVAIFSPDKENPGFQGVGFSIPPNDVNDALVQILKRGRPIRGFLGVEMRDLDPTVRSAIGYQEKDGAAVIRVAPGSPAEAAGLKSWDVVRAVDGQPIQSFTKLFSHVERTKVGQQITLDVWRKGASVELKATIAERGADVAPKLPVAPSGQGQTHDPDEVLKAIGLEVRDLDVPERMRGFKGVVVNGVSQGGLAKDLLAPGDLIVAVNNSRMSSATEFFLYLAASAAVQDTTLHVLREGIVIRVNLPAVPRKE
ncbi:MAG: PDZ domain-containing protein, partial [Verrucomicrobiaceae bacterium]